MAKSVIGGAEYAAKRTVSSVLALKKHSPQRHRDHRDMPGDAVDFDWIGDS
jgi:hypothetical protein